MDAGPSCSLRPVGETHADLLVRDLLAAHNSTSPADSGLFARRIVEFLSPQSMVVLGNLCIAEPHVQDDRIQYLIYLLDQLLFDSKVGTVLFEWDNTLMLRKGGRKGECGRTSTGEILIVVDPHPPCESAWLRAWSIIGTLLHECCHAFFLRACGIPGTPGVHSTCTLRTGATGHGPAWVDLALAVQRRGVETAPLLAFAPIGIAESIAL